MTTTGARTAAHLLVDCLAAEGCEYVFSVPGEETMDVLDALSTHRQVRHITTRHEQGAAFMADVYGRLTGRAAVAMGTLGPGATNLVTGSNMRTMSTNWCDSLWSLSSPVWPVIATIGAWSR